jgi:hypothetical protein
MDRILHRVFDTENINFIPFPGEARREAPDAIQQEVDIEPKETAAKPEASASKGKAVFSKAIPDSYAYSERLWLVDLTPPTAWQKCSNGSPENLSRKACNRLLRWGLLNLKRKPKSGTPYNVNHKRFPKCSRID